jgi:hypothetical protein
VDGPFLPDTFAPLEDAQRIAEFLIRQDLEARFAHATQARIAFLLQQPALMLHGQPADAVITAATVQGFNRLLFTFLLSRFEPDGEALEFLVYVDAAGWERRGWNEEPGPSGFPIEREALIFHELCHLRQLETGEGEPRFHHDGRPMLGLVRHTYERFDTEIRRYGPRTLGLEQLAVDIAEGAKVEKARPRQRKLRAVK